MATLKRQRNPFGWDQAKFKTGATNGGFGTNPGAVMPGSALTPSGDDEVALAGENDLIIGFVSEVDVKNGLVRYFTDYEIQDIRITGTVTAGNRLVGASDTNRGLAKAAIPTYAAPATPTVAELRDAAEIATNARWVVEIVSGDKATVVP